MMLYALWNGELLNAEDVAQTEAIETQIRLASGNKELRCKDPNCAYPVICYKNGQVRSAHFAHITKGDCDYADFDVNDVSVVRNARKLLFDHFAKFGYDVKREQKLPNSRRYCHLLFNIGGRNIVLQIAQSTTLAKDTATMTTECEKCDYELLWIVLDSSYVHQYEKHNYHAMRYSFNRSAENDLLALDLSNNRISQTKWDNSKNYSYRGQTMLQYDGQDVHYYREVKSINDLRIVNGSLTLNGFYQRFDDWRNAKNAAFEEWKRKIDEEYQRKLDRAKSITQNLTFPKPHPTPEKKVYPPLSESELKQYAVGMHVRHRIYGDGIIVSIDYATQKIEIKYDKRGLVRPHSLATLVGAGTLKIL